MKGPFMFSALILGLSSVNAIPHQVDSRDISMLEGRAPKPAAPQTIMADDKECINIPMLYAGYMDKATGAWDRYQCDSGTPIRSFGTAKDPAKRQVATNELRMCMDTNLISKFGVIKTHIPPSICPVLHGGGDRLQKGDYESLLSGLTALITDHLGRMSLFNTVVVHGPANGFTDAETEAVLTRLFGTGISTFDKLSSQSATGGITRVDLTGTIPRLFIDGTAARITVY